MKNLRKVKKIYIHIYNCRGGEPLFSIGQNIPHENINRYGFPELLTSLRSHWEPHTIHAEG